MSVTLCVTIGKPAVKEKDKEAEQKIGRENGRCKHIALVTYQAKIKRQVKAR